MVLWQNFARDDSESPVAFDTENEETALYTADFLRSLNLDIGIPVLRFTLAKGDGDKTSLSMSIHNTFAEAICASAATGPCVVKIQEGDLLAFTYTPSDVESSRPMSDLPIDQASFIRIGKSNDPYATAAMANQILKNEPDVSSLDLMSRCSRSAIFEISGLLHIPFDALYAVSEPDNERY
jgi:hypothetical protein